MEITKEEIFKKAKELFGADNEQWRFRCPACGNIQSACSIRENQKNNIFSQRFGKPKKGDAIYVERYCYAPNCDWSANGLFNSGILIILDPTKPHDENLKENCYYIFPFAE